MSEFFGRYSAGLWRVGVLNYWKLIFVQKCFIFVPDIDMRNLHILLAG
jgi:hypothetical protein